MRCGGAGGRTPSDCGAPGGPQYVLVVVTVTQVEARARVRDVVREASAECLVVREAVGVWRLLVLIEVQHARVAQCRLQLRGVARPVPLRWRRPPGPGSESGLGLGSGLGFGFGFGFGFGLG
eukprot:scaffold9644_cov54-Phaeocystis_antarctica.AAC.2